MLSSRSAQTADSLSVFIVKKCSIGDTTRNISLDSQTDQQVEGWIAIKDQILSPVVIDSLQEIFLQNQPWRFKSMLYRYLCCLAGSWFQCLYFRDLERSKYLFFSLSDRMINFNVKN